MIVILERHPSSTQIADVCRMLADSGLDASAWQEPACTVIGGIGTIEAGARDALTEQLEHLSYVDCVRQIDKPYRMVSREWKNETSLVTVRDGLAFGGKELVLIAGPCSVESHGQLLRTAREVKKHGAQMLRGGAFKPRTSPHFFQGLGLEGLQYLHEVSLETGLPVVTEVMDAQDLDMFETTADMFQIGSRNMQNYSLLKAVGKRRKPVLLKRGMSATVDELLQAAEYVMSGGNAAVVLCERGIRTFETATRNTLDLNAIPLLKRLTHLPVIVDPSHGTGLSELVIPMSLAAIAAGADGLIVEVHEEPQKALSDGRQSITPSEFSLLVERADAVACAVGRRLPCS